MSEYTSICDVEGCDHVARYVETGDGSALRNPKIRCADHGGGSGLWRDMAATLEGKFSRYEELDNE